MTEEKKFEDLTNEELKEIKIEFAPGCFDHFEGTQEELNELIAEIKNMISNGTIHEHSRLLTEDEFDELPEDVQDHISGFFSDDANQKRKLQ